MEVPIIEIAVFFWSIWCGGLATQEPHRRRANYGGSATANVMLRALIKLRNPLGK